MTMRYDPRKHDRQSIRMRGWDYSSPGLYFVTLLVKDRAHLLAEIVNGRSELTKCGEVATSRWLALPDHHPQVVLDAFVIMPDHIHALMGIAQDDDFVPRRQNMGRLAPGSLGAIVGSYKSSVSRLARRDGHPFGWQRGFYERLVRSAKEAERVRAYIASNPAKWQRDRRD